jgi:hypothetical protein
MTAKKLSTNRTSEDLGGGRPSGIEVPDPSHSYLVPHCLPQMVGRADRPHPHEFELYYNV